MSGVSKSQTAAAVSSLRGLMPDVWGGLAAMLVALPSSIAFGVLVFSSIAPEFAAQGAMIGMVGAATMGLVAPLVGRTPGLISAPCAPAAAILSGLALTLVQAGLEPIRIMALLGLTALLSAGFQLLYGALRGGRLIKFIPYPVVSGYLSGVGVIIVLGQVPRFLGLAGESSLLHGLFAFEEWRVPGILVGAVTMTFMLASPKLTKRVPAAILGLLGGILSYFALAVFLPELRNLQGNPLIIGQLQASGSLFDTASARWEQLRTVRIEDLRLVAYSAAALSVLLCIDTLKTCVVLDALTRRRHNSNRELLGQGAANLATWLCGGMPGAGTMGPTLVNNTSGGRTLKSGVAEGSFVILAILLLYPLIAWVPVAALAGVLLIVAFRMIDWQAFRLLQHPETRLDFFVIATVVVVAETVGLIAASATGVGLAILLFIRDQIKTTVLRRSSTLQQFSSKTRRLHEARTILHEHGDLGGIYELQGNLFFGTTDQLFTDLEADLAVRKWILFDLRRVQTLDFTAAHLFAQMHERLQERGGGLLFCGFPSSTPQHQDIQAYLSRVGLIGDGSKGIRIFDMRDEALEWMENMILALYGWNPAHDEVALALEDIELLHGLDAAIIAELKTCVQERSVGANQKIFSYGDGGDEIFLISRGNVDILLPLPSGKYHHLATFGQGDFFGEMAFLDGEKRSAHAYANTPCEMFVISRQAFDKCAALDARLGARIFSRLATVSSQRLRQADIELRTLEDR